jgi:hypothetical protein
MSASFYDNASDSRAGGGVLVSVYNAAVVLRAEYPLLPCFLGVLVSEYNAVTKSFKMLRFYITVFESTL